jgi:hypothetical protein
MVVQIPLKRFRESGVTLVECPDCTCTRTLEPHGGALRCKSHNKLLSFDMSYRADFCKVS